MDVLEHSVLFVLAGFAAFGHLTERRSNILTLLVLVLPSFGVYWLGPWALLTYVVGYVMGMGLFVSHSAKDKDLH
ncbi:hypothetical protein [Noviherbaspirillum massiliense]|uniref:hypothetical protein n=1 Tax=Noviherbaspirillum massiliense TaxID=1465823 RepID=UPI00031CFB51|nr:hypothetical protein [Noviherbaspirillum massiliense]